MQLSAQLGLAYFASELALRFSRRSAGTAQRVDAGSLILLWLGIAVGIVAGTFAPQLAPTLGFTLPFTARVVLVVIFLAALAFRWWAILVLGRFFTVDVAIARDHHVVTHGPYRFVRHPSYTGMMLAFVALAVTFQNALSLVAILAPISAALAYRIRVEERALAASLGETYRRYQSTTRRLIPGVY